jgi:23S rRNA pseudouridine1911/1915/1917 synthase
VDLRVPPEHAGERLDVFLARSAGSRAAAQRLIEGGAVLVDGRPRAKRHALAAGELVSVGELAVEAEPDAPEASFAIAFEDEHLLVIDKPAGVVVHPGAGHRAGTLVQALEGRVAGGGDPDRPGVVHRLDRDTSGLLVMARSDAVHAALQQALRERRIEREYVALVDGRPAARRGTIDAPLGRDRRVRTRMSTETDQPREAVTHFEVDRQLGERALLRVRLETGRTHQIRVHLEAIGLPVSGDRVYGVPHDLGLERQFLHAGRLAFTHPLTEQRIAVVSPLPSDLAAALARAEEAV